MTDGPTRPWRAAPSLVTRASDGIGAEAAKVLAAWRDGARHRPLGRQAAAGRRGGRHPSRWSPTARSRDVRRLADQVHQRVSSLDILSEQRRRDVRDVAADADGHEPNFQVNTTAPTS